jgi:hypothetical protein
MPRWLVVVIVLALIWLIASPTGFANFVVKIATSIGIFMGKVLG